MRVLPAWLLQRIFKFLSAQEVLRATCAARAWSQCGDMNLQVWFRLAKSFAPRCADEVANGGSAADERRQLRHILSETAEFLRGLGAPRRPALEYMRGSSKSIESSTDGIVGRGVTS